MSKLLSFWLLVWLWCAPLSQSVAQTFGPLGFNPFPDSVKTARSWLWLPPQKGEEALRGLVVLPDYEAGTAIWADSTLGWRQFCEQQRLGMLLHDFTNRVGEKKLLRSALGPALLQAHLALWANQTGRTELPRLGWILMGLSQGGMQAFAFAREQPEKAIAVLQIHPSTASIQFETRAQWSDPRVHGIPMLYAIGGQDNIGGALGEAYACSRRLLNLFLAPARAFDPPWTAYLERAVPHAALGDASFPQQWLAAVLALRLPELAPFFPLRSIIVRQGWAGHLRWGWYGGRNQFQEAKELVAVPYALQAVAEDTVPPDYLHRTWLPGRELISPWAQVQNVGATLAVGPKPGNTEEIRLWPNPQRVGQSVTIVAPGLQYWEVVDHTGKVLDRGAGKATDSAVLDTRFLPAGTYWVRLKTARGMTQQLLVLFAQP